MIDINDIRNQLEEIKEQSDKLILSLDSDSTREEIAALEKETIKEDFWQDNENSQKCFKESRC